MITRVKSTKIGLKETESNKACTGLIRKKLYELVRFYSRTMFTKWNHDKFEVRMNNKSIHRLQSNPTLNISKLILCTNAHLIWCSYFEWKTTIFNPRIV